MKERLYHRKHKRVELYFNVLLITEWGMQRGCRVVNISQGGVLLEWSIRRDDVSEIRKYINVDPGMFVNLFFILGAYAKKENINISAKVIRTTTNGIAIEFHQSQPALMESLSVKEPVEGHFLMPVDELQLIHSPPDKRVEGNKNRRAFLLFIAGAVTGTISITVLNYFNQYVADERQGSTQIRQAMVDEHQVGDLDSVKDKIEVTKNSGLKRGAAIQRTEKTMSDNRAETAIGKAESHGLKGNVVQPGEQSASTGVAGNDKSVRDANDVAGIEWFINLVTLSNKQSADKLTDKAHNLGIPVMQEQVNRGDTPLWRLRVYGFTDKARAEEYAEMIKQHIRLDDVWIMNRKKP
jgi:hypothetical protein